MDQSVILLYLAIAALSSIECKCAAMGLMKEIGINPKLYPKHYMSPNPRLKKWFKINRTKIPKYLNNQLYMAIFFATLGPINSMVYGFVSGDSIIAGILVMIHVILIIINSSYVVITSIIFKKFR